MPALTSKALANARSAAAAMDVDVYLYNGSLDTPRDFTFIELVHASKRRNKALLCLTTYGGDADIAYKISRCLQGTYDHFSILISGKCKSAGTLIAIGANEIVFAPFGELGPLDMQMTRIDTLDKLQSGLVIQDALHTLEQRAFDKYCEVASGWITEGVISFNAATEAAASFVAQLYRPIFARIDPEEVGARTRAMKVVADYGRRLAVKSGNVKEDTLRLLNETYPSHSFVIDQQEAETLFERVRVANAHELALVEALARHARFPVPGDEFECHALHDRTIQRTSREVEKKSDQGPHR